MKEHFGITDAQFGLLVSAYTLAAVGSLVYVPLFCYPFLLC